MGVTRAVVRAALAVGVAAAAIVPTARTLAGTSDEARPAAPPETFRRANELARGGDYPKAIALYGELAAGGAESASLYWNWGQAAAARGAIGEAFWALLRARELSPGDRAVAREIERLREAANLDPAELAPEPLAAVARFVRRFRLDLVGLGLLAASLVVHAVLRIRGARFSPAAVWTLLALGLACAAAPLAATLARPTGVVVRRQAPLADAASPTAEAIGALREGEVVPILEASGDYLRVEDSSGARGWALADDVRPLDRAPRAAP
jgi:hypothetical protein